MKSKEKKKKKKVEKMEEPEPVVQTPHLYEPSEDLSANDEEAERQAAMQRLIMKNQMKKVEKQAKQSPEKQEAQKKSKIIPQSMKQMMERAIRVRGPVESSEESVKQLSQIGPWN